MNNFINQVVKIQLSAAGYLPDYPYHMISSAEMADAFFETKVTSDSAGVHVDSDFINDGDFFHQLYLCPSTWSADIQSAYQKLHRAIQLIVGNWKYLQTASVSSIIIDEEDIYCELTADRLPDWIYSYVLCKVIGLYSPSEDIHDLLVLLDQDNINDEFLETTAANCYKISSEWLSKFPGDDKRPPSIFGEMHVIKSLRLSKQGE